MTEPDAGMPVQREQKGHRGAFYLERGGIRLAEMTFSASADGKLFIIDHTEVSDSLRGQGAARRLVEAAVAWARESRVKLFPVCPFAKAVFDREPAFHDVLG
jgi:predicted GNAT family acetyltransferase